MMWPASPRPRLAMRGGIMDRLTGALIAGVLLAVAPAAAAAGSGAEDCTIIRHHADGTTETSHGPADEAAHAADGSASANAKGRHWSSASASASSSSTGGGHHSTSTSTTSSDGRTVTTTRDD